MVPIWGWADPGEAVTVSAAGKSATAKADASGKWTVKIGPFKVGDSFTVTVKGKNTIVLKNVLAGEVWICSGQSNMEWSVNASGNPAQERAAANWPLIRHVKINRSTSMTPLDDAANTGWQICSPRTAGNFTAVGYYFGRHLHRNLKVPIGLINTSWGGTIVETWTSAETLKTHPDFKAKIEEFAAMGDDVKKAGEAYQKKLIEWQKAYDKALNAADEQWQVAGHDDAGWKSMKLPGNWEKQGLPNFDGIVWFRKTVDIPASWAGKEVALTMSPIDDIDTTWVNGTRVGGLSDWRAARHYKVPGSVVKAGKLTIAVRVHDTGGGGGFHGSADLMWLRCAGVEGIRIACDWKYNLSKAMAKVPPRPAPPPFNSGPNHPTLLHNAMVNPIIPYAMRGAIWYQG
ncbi:MAG: sugar-binding domain-containing protein, partial [Verrucomicrobiota bacterium]